MNIHLTPRYAHTNVCFHISYWCGRDFSLKDKFLVESFYLLTKALSGFTIYMAFDPDCHMGGHSWGLAPSNTHPESVPPEIRLLTCNQFYLCPKGHQADMMIHRLKMIIPLHSLFLHHQMPSRSAFSCLNCCKSVLIDAPSSSLTSFKYGFHIAVNSDLASLLNSQNY